MQFGFSLIMRGHEATREAFVTMAKRAEALGFDALWCSDHLIVPPRRTSRYPGSADGTFPPAWHERYWEPITVLSHLAACTRRIALGTSVLILAMRHPIEVAAEVADLDQLAQGRFIFGVGLGWFQEEFDVLGWPFRERGARTDEGLAICKALWTQDAPRFAGPNYRFDEVSFGPKPARQPHPPIWIAGNSEAALRRTVRFGDVWHPVLLSHDDLAARAGRLRALVAEAGRDPASVGIGLKTPLVFQDAPAASPTTPCMGRSQDVLAALSRYGELGVEHFTFDLKPETLANALATMERFAQDVRPHLP
ncbi:MAG: LLM class F420-dependent oxidoreductase [Candidatus Lambdaproteobacteria bacterium]|nr:LLM class F420-dependent oxidoreductase [Candidatus Lambdaproteobacteria bacterium]